MKEFLWGFLLGKSSGHNKTIFFTKMVAWWMPHFLPQFPLTFVVVRGERISCLAFLLQIICIKMQCWLDDRVGLICRGRKRTKNIEILWHPHQGGKWIVAEGGMWVSFYRFLRQVSVNTISSVSLWILMRTKTLFARRFDTFTSVSFCMITENSYIECYRAI